VYVVPFVEPLYQFGSLAAIWWWEALCWLACHRHGGLEAAGRQGFPLPGMSHFDPARRRPDERALDQVFVVKRDWVRRSRVVAINELVDLCLLTLECDSLDQVVACPAIARAALSGIEGRFWSSSWTVYPRMPTGTPLVERLPLSPDRLGGMVPDGRVKSRAIAFHGYVAWRVWRAAHDPEARLPATVADLEREFDAWRTVDISPHR
jgi:hypothetical protein